MDIVPRRPFYVLVEIFSKRPAYLPKHMLFAVCGDAPPCIIHIAGDEDPTSGDDDRKYGEERGAKA